jgi:hypothetical protein
MKMRLIVTVRAGLALVDSRFQTHSPMTTGHSYAAFRSSGPLSYACFEGKD